MTRIVPAAGEASVCIAPPQGVGEGSARWDALTEEERAAENHARANARATKKTRQYMTANRLFLMWVGTYAGEGHHGPEGRARVMADAAVFIRRLRRRLGHDFPAWWSPELHPGKHGRSKQTCPMPEQCGCAGHGWHINFFLGFPYPKRQLEELWGEGMMRFVDFRKHKQARGKGVLEALRLAARYGTKYASKDWAAEQLVAGAHRYEVTQGFAPQEIVVETDDVAQGVAAAVEVFGGRRPIKVWRSEDQEDWTGPPCAVLFFALGAGP